MIYDKTEIFNKKTNDTIKFIRILGKNDNISFLLCFALANDEKDTTYKTYINTSAETVNSMSQDVIPHCVNVMFNGFQAVKYNTMEDDLENHVMEADTNQEKRPAVGRGEPFDLSVLYQKDIEPLVDHVFAVCQKEDIPCLMCFAIKEDGNETTYQKYIHEPKEGFSSLTRDILSVSLKIINEGYTSSLVDLEEDDEEAFVSWGELGKKNQRRQRKKEEPREDHNVSYEEGVRDG